MVNTGLSDGHRLLEDHRDRAAAERAQLGGPELEQVAALEQDFAAGDRARRDAAAAP
jgi:hypothetical protein